MISGSLFRAALRSVRRAAILWSVALGAIVAVTMAFWPAFRGASGISQAIDSLPPALVDAFGLQDFGSPAGFLRGNLYEFFVPLLLCIAAVALVNGQTASDEAAGRLELFLAQPVARGSLFLARVAAALVAVAVMVLVTLIVQLATDPLVDLQISAGYVVATVVLCGLLAALYGALGYLIACLRPRPSLVLGVGIGLTIAGYLISALFPISELLEPWRVISPWNWAFGGGPLEQSTDLWRYAALALPTIVLVAIGTAVVRRRDVAAA